MTYDVMVIGAGSGGLAAAKAAAACGAKVAIAESKQLGGTCINRGCIPKKLMVQAAAFVEQQQIAKTHGWVSPEGRFEWKTLKSAMNRHLEKLRQSQQQTLQEANIEIITAAARLVDAHTVAVGDREVQAKHVIIAVGGLPTLPDIPGVELALTSRDMFDWEQLPEQLAIVGGGYIGVEFGCMMAQLGAKVTLIDTDSQVLSGFDSDLRNFVQASLQRLEVDFIGQTTCKEIEANGSALHLSLSGEHVQSLKADAVLMAVGRTPNLQSLGLEKAGIELKDGYVQVNDYGQTTQDTVYAIGDCVGRLPLTPVAIAEGKAVVKTICQQQPTTADYRWIPSAVFSAPPIAYVGWSESIARNHMGDDVETVCNSFTSLSHSLMDNPQPTLIKLVLCKSSRQILGAHIAGNQAPDLIQGLVPALRQGLALDELASTLGIHPTSGEELFDLA
ncbi:MAG: dihydrolipoyl dehydrogenase family protein [Leptolyngbyaceae cyanobacterium]